MQGNSEARNNLYNKIIDNINTNKLISFEEYCKISERAIQEDIKQIVEQKQLINILTNPKILLEPRGKFNKKQEEEVKSTGERIIHNIAYAWDYYIRIVQMGTKKNNFILSNPETAQEAKKILQNMLKQLSDNTYCWENYSKDELPIQEKARKDVESQITLITLLRNMLNSQTEKIKQLRRKEGGCHGQPQEHILKENNQIQQAQPNKRFALDIKSYFQRKRERKEEKIIDNPILELEERRKFNAAVLRYCADTTIQ